MATEWQSKRGKSMWQPTLSDGRRLWRETLWGEPDGTKWGWRGERDDTPALYSKRKAERIERRRARREEREEMDETYREVRRAERPAPVLYGGTRHAEQRLVEVLRIARGENVPDFSERG